MAANATIPLGFTETSSGNGIVSLSLKLANRHGLIAGATGTGKTVTLQALAESFSSQGVPVFFTDIKGDLSGISQPGKSHPKIDERLEKMGLPSNVWKACPSVFWDLFGKEGHPIRATISDMGPLLLARLLDLNDTQEGVITIAFAVADDEGLLLLDLKDLRSMLNHVAENAKELRSIYGNVSASSVGAIQRRLLKLERSGAEDFFGEPMLQLADLLQVDKNGQGQINVLVAKDLVKEPIVYSTLLLWLLSELFEELPEVGDADKPKLVVFFDEAHLMFRNTPVALVEKLEQVVRLIRSKGVGVYLVTQSPGDVPDAILAQLANRFLHALRALTPRQQKVVKVAAETFRSDQSFSVVSAIGELGVGEALVSTLQDDGTPSFVQRTFIKPPISRIGPASTAEMAGLLAASPYAGQYDDVIDRDSAYERLAARASAIEETQKPLESKEQREMPKPKRKGRQRQGVADVFIKSLVRSIGGRAGRSLIRGIMGSLFKGR
jgi:DNA helicase HerA-like ATPase